MAGRECELNERQLLFCEQYAIDRNAKQAAIRAGYSARTAEMQGSRLLSHDKVRSRIAELVQAASERAGLSAELVLASLRRELQFDPSQLYTEDGRLKSIHDIPEDARKCLVGMETALLGDGSTVVQKVKWVNQSQAREQAMKHLGMFEKDNAQKPPPVNIGRIELTPMKK